MAAYTHLADRWRETGERLSRCVQHAGELVHGVIPRHYDKHVHRGVDGWPPLARQCGACLWGRLHSGRRLQICMEHLRG